MIPCRNKQGGTAEISFVPVWTEDFCLLGVSNGRTAYLQFI